MSMFANNFTRNSLRNGLLPREKDKIYPKKQIFSEIGQRSYILYRLGGKKLVLDSLWKELHNN